MSKIIVEQLRKKEWWVKFTVGFQTFRIGPIWDNRKEACWYASRFREAINVIKGTGIRVYQFNGVKSKRKR